MILYENYPNPFDPTTNIKYQLLKNCNVKLVILELLGNEIDLLADEFQHPGTYEIDFNARNLASGVYFYRFQAADYLKTSK